MLRYTMYVIISWGFHYHLFFSPKRLVYIFTDMMNIVQMTSWWEGTGYFLVGKECPFPGDHFPLWNNVPGRARVAPRVLWVPYMLWG